MNKVIMLFLLLVSPISIAGENADAMTDKQAYEYLKPDNEKTFYNIVNGFAYNAATGALRAGKTIGGQTFDKKTPDELIEEFERNEIVASDYYNNRLIIVRGAVKKISIDVMGNGSINVGGKKSIGGGVIFKVDKNSEWVRALSKGDDVVLMCNIDKYLLFNLSARCDLAENIMMDLIKKEFSIDGEWNKPKRRTSAAMYAYFRMVEKEIGGKCDDNYKNCATAMRGFKPKETSPKGFDLWLQTIPDPQR